jgi:CHRD domain
MRRNALLVLVLAATLIPAGNALGQTKNFRTHLTGAEEVPPRATQAQGQAKFKVIDDDAIRFRLNVANIENVFAAHIHCGATGVNGPVGVTLFNGPVGAGPVNGTLAKGTITAPDAGNGCGWTNLAAVIAAIESGLTYVNVHTNDGVEPPNTGPGDFPGGEIRGQL